MNSLLPNWCKSALNNRFYFFKKRAYQTTGVYLNDIPSFLFVEKFLLTSTKRARKPKLGKKWQLVKRLITLCTAKSKFF